MNNQQKMIDYKALREKYQSKADQVQKIVDDKPTKELKHLKDVYEYRVSAVDRCIENLNIELQKGDVS